MIDPDALAYMFTDWAKSEGMLPRITEDQCRDLAKAFAAGYVKATRLLVDYETGYREGASSLIADIRMQFTEDAGTMDDLLGFFRLITKDPELQWPDNGEDGLIAKGTPGGG